MTIFDFSDSATRTPIRLDAAGGNIVLLLAVFVFGSFAVCVPLEMSEPIASWALVMIILIVIPMLAYETVFEHIKILHHLCLAALILISFPSLLSETPQIIGDVPLHWLAHGVNATLTSLQKQHGNFFVTPDMNSHTAPAVLAARDAIFAALMIMVYNFCIGLKKRSLRTDYVLGMIIVGLEVISRGVWIIVFTTFNPATLLPAPDSFYGLLSLTVMISTAAIVLTMVLKDLRVTERAFSSIISVVGVDFPIGDHALSWFTGYGIDGILGLFILIATPMGIWAALYPLHPIVWFIVLRLIVPGVIYRLYPRSDVRSIVLLFIIIEIHAFDLSTAMAVWLLMNLNSNQYKKVE